MAGFYSTLRRIFTGNSNSAGGVMPHEQLVAKIIIPSSGTASFAPTGGSRIAISAIGPTATDIVRRSVDTGEIIDSQLTNPVELVKESTEYFASARQFAPAAKSNVTPLPLRKSFARQIPLPRVANG